MKKQDMISKMTQFLQTDHDDMFESLESAFRASMKDCGSHATCLWLEDGEIESETFLTDALAIAEMARHDVAFFVPKTWHEKCDWIWVEKDENHESDTFGEDLWCCSAQVMGVSDEVAHFVTMSDMWDTLLDYVDNDWEAEATRVMDYMRTWEEPAKTLIYPTISPAPAPQ